MNVGRVSTMIVTALLFAVPIINADAKQVCQKTTLYSLTFHLPQRQAYVKALARIVLGEEKVKESLIVVLRMCFLWEDTCCKLPVTVS